MFEDLTEQIEDKLKDECVVLFVTDMCPKCKQMYNTISNATDSIVYRVNLSEHMDIARRYSIQRVPLLCKYEDGHMVGKLPFELASIQNVKQFIS